MSKLIQAAIIGYGNVGKGVYDAIKNAPDIELRCVVKRTETDMPCELKNIWVTDIKDIRTYGDIDVAILTLPTLSCPDMAEALLEMGICTVDSYDVHGNIWELKCRLDKAAKKSGKAGIISAGWDPGSDSVIRALLEAMAPRGITFTNFGPGMSMGHSVAVKAIEGVENAMSVTIPTGSGVHRRMVYVQLKDGASIEKVTHAVKTDPYFIHDETRVIQVEDISKLLDVGSGAYITRKGVSGNTHNQIMEFNMKINNPSLTGQVLVSAARAVIKQQPGCYTLIEIPVIDMLAGDKKDLITRLV